MTFQELRASIQAILPAQVEMTTADEDYKCMFFRFTDSTEDTLDVEIELQNKVGEEIIVTPCKGMLWFFPPAFCTWLAMTSDLIANYRSE